MIKTILIIILIIGIIVLSVLWISGFIAITNSFKELYENKEDRER